MSSYLEMYSAGNSRAHDSSSSSRGLSTSGGSSSMGYGDPTDHSEDGDSTRRALESGASSLRKGRQKDAALQVGIHSIVIGSILSLRC